MGSTLRYKYDSDGQNAIVRAKVTYPYMLVNGTYFGTIVVNGNSKK